MDNLTRQIAEYAATLTYDELPTKVVRAAIQRVVDALACAIGGYGCEPATIGRRLAGAEPDRYRSRMLGIPERTTGESAAFVNTCLIRNLDFNDTWPGGHPSDSLGALLALAEAIGADGKRLLTSQVIAYELFVRFCNSAQLRERGWDQGFMIGIASVAALGHLMRLPVETIAEALSITCVANVPLRATRAGSLSLWKGAATAYAARNAVFGTLLAVEGMTGPDKPFEGRHGFWEQVTGPFELAPFGARGGDFATPNVRLKYWPVEYNTQAAVWTARAVREKIPLAELKEVEIATYWSAWHETGSEPEKWDPRTRETADHSMPYVFARTLVDGGITLAAFEPAAYLDPGLRPLMAKIKVRQDDAVESAWPKSIVMRAEATTTSGEHYSFEVVNPLGHEANPMKDEDTDAKLHAVADPVFGPDRAATVLAHWHSLPDLADLTPALDLLQP
ncbi:MAG: MmgE/PrpD family protein [Chloroflexi bacterium]|nr:MmgE/PrpD family protein [Chloroflexota bacterium]